MFSLTQHVEQLSHEYDLLHGYFEILIFPPIFGKDWSIG